MRAILIRRVILRTSIQYIVISKVLFVLILFAS